MDYLKMAEEDFRKAVCAHLLEEYEESLDSAWEKGYGYFLSKLTDEDLDKMPQAESMQIELDNAGNDELLNISIKKMWLDGYVSACSYYFEEKFGKGDFRCKKYKVYGCIEKVDKIEDGSHGERRMYTHIERVSEKKAEFWGVYEVQENGLEDWLADFRNPDDAQMFVLEKEKEEAK